MRNTLALLLLAFVIASCHSSKPITQAPQAVQTLRVESSPTARDSGLRFSAVVMPDSQVPLAFRVPGYVVSLKQVRGQNGRMRDIAEGDRVGRGTVQAQIRSTEYEDKVRQAASQTEAAEAAAQKAKFDFERATRLYATDSLVKPDFDKARAQYDSSQAELRGAQAQTAEAQVSFRDTSLAAPFSGDIVKKAVEVGAFVGPSVQTFSLANTDLVKIIIGVPDTVLRSIHLGQPVEVAIDAFPRRTFHARISRISSAADSTTRNFDVEVAIPNPDHLLKVGMIGSLQLANAESKKRASSLLVPLSAIVQAKDGQYGVYVIANSGAGEVARLQNVEIGAVNGTEITVVSGLAAGDQIITTGANLLKDGQPVEVLK
jgi:RND family efflux transporter MFP subunit